MGGGVDDLVVAAGLPFAPASSSVGGISGSLGVLRPPVEGPNVSNAGDSELLAFSSANS
jgi:hypothetical protein